MKHFCGPFAVKPFTRRGVIPHPARGNISPLPAQQLFSTASTPLRSPVSLRTPRDAPVGAQCRGPTPQPPTRYCSKFFGGTFCSQMVRESKRGLIMRYSNAREPLHKPRCHSELAKNPRKKPGTGTHSLQQLSLRVTQSGLCRGSLADFNFSHCNRNLCCSRLVRSFLIHHQSDLRIIHL